MTQIMAVLFLLVGVFGAVTSFGLIKDQDDAPSRFIGWVLLGCVLIVGAFGVLLLIA